MIAGLRLLGDDLVGGGNDGVGGGGDGGVDSLDGGLSLGLGLLGIVVSASGGADHHRDDGGGHKYLFHGCEFFTN